jgi:hypothetical protein
VNIQQSSIEAAALISATLEAAILNCDSPLPCLFCPHQRSIFNNPSTASFPLAVAECNSRKTTPEQQVGFSTVSGCPIVTIVFTCTLQLHQTCSVLLQKQIHRRSIGQTERREYQWRTRRNEKGEENSRPPCFSYHLRSCIEVSPASFTF